MTCHASAAAAQESCCARPAEHGNRDEYLHLQDHIKPVTAKLPSAASSHVADGWPAEPSGRMPVYPKSHVAVQLLPTRVPLQLPPDREGLRPHAGIPAHQWLPQSEKTVLHCRKPRVYRAHAGSYKLQVLRIRSKAVACLSLRSSVRKLRKGVNEPRLTSQHAGSIAVSVAAF
jgi:hypothetical protein